MVSFNILCLTLLSFIVNLHIYIYNIYVCETNRIFYPCPKNKNMTIMAPDSKSKSNIILIYIKYRLLVSHLYFPKNLFVRIIKHHSILSVRKPKSSQQMNVCTKYVQTHTYIYVHPYIMTVEINDYLMY